MHARSPERRYAFLEHMEMECRSGGNSYEACIEALAFHGSDRLLDFGCGEGVLYRYLPSAAKGGYRGVDITPASIQRAVGRFPDLAGRVETIGADCPLAPPAGFEKACAHMVLALVEDTGSALARINRALVPGGRLVVFTSAYRRYGQTPRARTFDAMMVCFDEFLHAKSHGGADPPRRPRRPGEVRKAHATRRGHEG